jgi:multidrug transporter EmrE-like cation transporter
MKASQLAVVGGLVLAESGAQYFLQKAVSHNRVFNIGVGVLLYAIVAIVYYTLLKSGDPMALANSVWNAGTEISIALLGLMVFRQKLSVVQWIGLAVTITGINMLGSSS